MEATITTDPPIAHVSTYEEYAAREDWDRTELWDGEVFLSPAPGEAHQRVLAYLFSSLMHHLEEQCLGELRWDREVRWKELRPLRPDLVYYRRERAQYLAPRLLVDPPDLVVEVVSPGSRSARRDRETKRKGYAEIGVPHYWILDPQERSVEEGALEGADYRLCQKAQGADTFQPRLFPGWALPLERLWRGLPKE